MNNRVIGGVASGLSDFFGIDATLVRALLVLGSLFSSGAVALIYLILWAVIPANTSTPTKRPRRGLVWIIAVSALIISGWSFLSDISNNWWVIVVIIVAVGLWVWHRLRRRRSWKTRKEFEQARLAWQRRLDEQAASSHTTELGGNPFQIDSFYSQPPPDDPSNPPSGFQF